LSAMGTIWGYETAKSFQTDFAKGHLMNSCTSYSNIHMHSLLNKHHPLRSSSRRILSVKQKDKLNLIL
jgi:hypothetical protein